MSDPCSKETNDKVMERIRKEFVATPTVEELEAEIERLKEGRCRFDCRTAKDNWVAGFLQGHPDATNEEAEFCYNEWKRQRS
jgi:hypothetical protein